MKLLVVIMVTCLLQGCAIGYNAKVEVEVNNDAKGICVSKKC